MGSNGGFFFFFFLILAASSSRPRFSVRAIFHSGLRATERNRPLSRSPESSLAGALAARPSPAPQKSGILAVLPEPYRVSQVLCRKASISPSSSSRTIPAILRPSAANQERYGLRELSQSVPAAKVSVSLQSSAPVNVPALASQRKFDAEIGGGGDDDNEVLPPYEIVARGSCVSSKTTFLVPEDWLS